MSPPLFLDTSGWFAAVAPPERHHALAARTYDAALRGGAPLLTTLLVVAEMHTLVMRWRDARTAGRFLDAIFDGAAHTVVPVDTDFVREAITRWVHGYAGQRFSLCDAVSFEVMRRERVSRALAFDRHFVTAGFEILS